MIRKSTVIFVFVYDEPAANDIAFCTTQLDHRVAHPILCTTVAVGFQVPQIAHMAVLGSLPAVNLPVGVEMSTHAFAMVSRISTLVDMKPLFGILFQTDHIDINDDIAPL
jgi:hypothetical protein